MRPPDQSDTTGNTSNTDDSAAYNDDGTAPLPPYSPHHAPQDDTPLPLPYDDLDPTYQQPPTYRPPVYQQPPPHPPTYSRTQRATSGQQQPMLPVPYQHNGQPVLPYPPPIIYQAAPQPIPAPVVHVHQRRSWFSITCSVLVILLLMFCGVIGVGIYNGVVNAGHAIQTAGATLPAYGTLVTFCGAEQTQQYGLAYQQFSSQLQQQITEDQFTQHAQQLDQQNGTITSCGQHSGSNATVSGNSVTIEVDVTRTFGSDAGGNAGKHQAFQGNITLVQEGNDWHINQIDTSLGLV
jgi:hypothetical protein